MRKGFEHGTLSTRANVLRTSARGIYGGTHKGRDWDSLTRKTAAMTWTNFQASSHQPHHPLQPETEKKRKPLLFNSTNQESHFLFRLEINTFCKPSWLMRKVLSQPYFSGAFKHSVLLTLLWLARARKISKEISGFAHICGSSWSLIRSNIMASMTLETNRNKHLGSWANCAEKALCGSLQRWKSYSKVARAWE